MKFEEVLATVGEGSAALFVVGNALVVLPLNDDGTVKSGPITNLELGAARQLLARVVGSIASALVPPDVQESIQQDARTLLALREAREGRKA